MSPTRVGDARRPAGTVEQDAMRPDRRPRLLSQLGYAPAGRLVIDRLGGEDAAG